MLYAGTLGNQLLEVGIAPATKMLQVVEKGLTQRG